MTGTHDVVSLIFLLAHVLSVCYYAGICCQDFLNSWQRSSRSPLHATLSMQPPWAPSVSTHTCRVKHGEDTQREAHTQIWWEVGDAPSGVGESDSGLLSALQRRSSPHMHQIWRFTATVPTLTNNNTFRNKSLPPLWWWLTGASKDTTSQHFSSWWR